MKVVYLINGLGVGGGERHLAHLAEGLQRRGHGVVVFCLTRGGVVAEELRRQGITVEQLSAEGRPRPGAWRRLVIELQTADALHTHFYYSDLAARTVLAACRPPRLISTRHETGFWMRRPHRWLESWLYRRFDRVVCVSQAVRRSLLERGVESRLLVHVRPGIPTTEESSARSSEVEPKTILYAGRLEQIKGADLLVDAFAQARDQLGGWRLVICGDGAERAALASQIEQLGLGDRCHLLGSRPHDEVQAMMRRATIFVLPSRAEAISLSLLEAMAAGTPVVASAVEGVQEVVTHRSTGLMVPPGSASALAAALVQLAAAPELRAMLGQAGQKQVATHYGLDRFVEQMLEVYSGAVSVPTEEGGAAEGSSSRYTSSAK